MSQRIFVLLLLAASTLVSAAAPAGDLERERRVFQQVYPDAELGIWKSVAEHESLLRNYRLWPDLRATYLQATLGQDPDDEIQAFLAHYGDLKPARTLRYHYTLHLAKHNRWAEFRRYYERHYADLGVAQLDCLYLQARMPTADSDVLLAQARPLWLVGHSQVKECDPIFRRLKDSGKLDKALYAERYALAVNAKQLSMARYLARELGADKQQEAARWTQAYGQPRAFIDKRAAARDEPVYREQLLAAVTTIAYTDPLAAGKYWQAMRVQFAFNATQRSDISRHIVLWQARNHLDGAYVALVALQDEAVDTEVLRWRVRSALRLREFDNALQHLDELPADELAKSQWQYWRAVALEQTGDDRAAALYATLAAERSYYGFLAADAISADYAFGHRQFPVNETVLANLAERAELQRARELFLVGLDGRGRSEWDSAVRKMTHSEQLQAALLAHRWGWHSRAIATAASTERYDDLDLRYPLPFAETFSRHSAAANVRPSWAFGIARSESLFMRDIRSSAGAIGLMQLMPSTGRQTAREINEPWTGFKTLTDPEANIRLGTWFLGRMQTRFGDNPVLATAAYNAGPLRVDAWLPRDRALDARIWIETIPYAETRNYVRRVMTADAIFNWRMDGQVVRLSERLQVIPAAGDITQLAATRVTH